MGATSCVAGLQNMWFCGTPPENTMQLPQQRRGFSTTPLTHGVVADEPLTLRRARIRAQIASLVIVAGLGAPVAGCTDSGSVISTGGAEFDGEEVDCKATRDDPMAPDGGGTSAGAGAGASEGEFAACQPNMGSQHDGDVNVVFCVEYQRIRGYGGINIPGAPDIPSWETITDLTPEQVDTAFGQGEGQMGLSILRLRLSYDASRWESELPTAQRAAALGATIFASPWSPPIHMKSNHDLVGGHLNPTSYGEYAEHLLAFRDYMHANDVPIDALSLQNEPDIRVDYESCDWTPAQLVTFLSEQGGRFGDTKVIAAESFNFNHATTNPILQSADAEPHVDIIGGHIYGGGLADYPLARELGKELWMTEHYTDSDNDANDWAHAFAVGKEVNDAMKANFSAYVWWYIRRFYGLITDDGQISKRGYLLAQYSKFIRPGAIRIRATDPSARGVEVTAYKDGQRLIVVAVNSNRAPEDITIDIHPGCVASLTQYTTSETKNLTRHGVVEVLDSRAQVTLDPQSVTTLVSP